MKVKDILKEIKKGNKEYGKDFLEWDIYTEQISEIDKKDKKESNWGSCKDGDGWEYFECVGFNTYMPHNKIFTININY